MGLVIRRAELRDAAEISAVHSSTIAWWNRFPGGSPAVPAPGEELSDFERFLNGGPWTSVRGTEQHLAHVLASGQIPLVAVEDEHVVGELELIVGEEPRLGRVAHIDVLVVERAYQGRGVGQALVTGARKRAESTGCAVLSATPEPDAEGFYVRCGFTQELLRHQEVRLPLASGVFDRAGDLGGLEIGPRFATYSPLEIILGGFQTSFATWIKREWRIPELHGRWRSEEGRLLPGKVGHYWLSGSGNPAHDAAAWVWAPPDSDAVDAFVACGRRARALGFQVLGSTIRIQDRERFERLGAVLGGETHIVGAPLVTVSSS